MNKLIDTENNDTPTTTKTDSNYKPSRQVIRREVFNAVFQKVTKNTLTPVSQFDEVVGVHGPSRKERRILAREIVKNLRQKGKE